jgi:aspartate aminotransferase
MKINSKINESATLVFAEAVRKRIAEGEKIISMGIGEPDIDVPGFLKEGIIKALRKNSSSKYLNSLGNVQLREAIAIDLKKRNGFHFESNQIMITAGAKQALQLILLSLVQDYDEVIFFSPNYVSYIPQVLLCTNEARYVEVNLNEDFSLNRRRFVESISDNTKILILNNPNNPTGKIFTEEEFKFILNHIENRDIYVIMDDVYELLVYGKPQQYSIVHEKLLEDKIFYINSFSKSHSIPGWRIGYMCAPTNQIGNIVKIQQHVNTNTSSIIQEACISIYENGYEFLDEYKVKLKKRSELIYMELRKYLKNDLVKPEGGFFFFLDISQTNLNSNDFCARLIDEEGVALTPGIAFGENWDNYVRLSFGIDDDHLELGLKKLVNFLKKF